MHGMNQATAVAPETSTPAASVYVRATGLVVLGVGIAVLAGWAFEIDALKGIAPGLATMKPLTAANFLLSGVVLLMSSRPGEVARDRIGWFCALAVTVWSGLTLLEYATGIDFHIDRVLFPNHLVEPGVIPGRMSIITAINFVLFGTCRITGDRRESSVQAWFVTANILGLALSFLAICGYAYGVPVLYHPIPATSIALNTAVTFAVLFTGVAATRPDLGWMARICSPDVGGSFVRRALPAIVIGVPAFGWLRLQGQLAGLYDLRAGLALFTIFNVAFLTAVILVSGWTSDRLAARRLSQKVKQQSALAILSGLTLRSNDFKALRERAVQMACDVLGVEFGSLNDVTPSTGRPEIMVTVAGGAATTTIQKRRDDPAIPILDALLTEHTPRLFSDIDPPTQLKLSTYFQAPGAQSGLIMPIQIGGKTLGHLAMLSTTKRTFFIDDVEFLQRLRNLLEIVRDRQMNLDKLHISSVALEHAAQGITITDESAREPMLVYANPTIARMTGYTVDEIMSNAARTLRPRNPDLGLIEKIMQAKAKREPYEVEILVQRKDGTEYLNLAKGSPVIDQDGRLTYYVVISEDVTDRHLREEKLRETQKMQAVGQMTGGVAHEFNNLLAVIKSNAEDMRDDLKESPVLHDQADLVLQAADRGAGLVRQLLAFSRKQEIQPIVTDLNVFLESFVALLKRTLEANIAINVRTAAGLPPVKIDPGQMETALLNIALNCRDAMPSGGQITIETKLALIDADYADQNADASPGTYILLTVKDTGTGMPKEVLAHAFQPFFTTKEVGAGTGLGLSMVYGFVQQSGGHIKLRSEPGFGTTVYIYLPPAEENAALRPETAAAAAMPVAAGRTILLVEDDDLVRQSVKQKLVRLGYDVTTAPTALDAIVILERQPAFDLVFTDVIMPGAMNGADLAREVQRRWPAIKILMSSGYTEAAVLGKVNMPDGIRLLPKPYANADLERALHEVLGRKSA
ncbi:MAG: response regulator [Rhodospirillaceae bacterium]|nr:MAG: response regulator [Rhodospirillaceae bacterium]